MPFFSARPTSAFSIRSKRPTLPWLTRQVITTGYTAAGYANSVTWRNVNKIVHSTEVTSDLGDLLQAAANYTSGAHNRNVCFIWGTNGTGTEGGGAYTNTSCFNMRSDTTYTKTSSMNTANTVGDSGTIQQANLDGTNVYSWQNGNQGAAAIQKFNLTTEVHQSTQSTSFDQGGTGAGAHFEENWGYFWTEGGSASVDANGNGKRKFVFATETESTPGNVGWHGQQKGVSSKVGKGYAGNEGSYNGGNNFRVWTYSTESYSTVAKPITNSGEENLDMGQDKQFMLGMYDGAQNNRAWRLTYSTNSGAELGATAQPRGTQLSPITGGSVGSAIGGRSSGHSYWRD